MSDSSKLVLSTVVSDDDLNSEHDFFDMESQLISDVIRGQITPNILLQEKNVRIYTQDKNILIQGNSFENGNFSFAIDGVLAQQLKDLYIEVHLHKVGLNEQYLTLISQVPEIYLGNIVNVDFRTTLVYYLQKRAGYSYQQATVRVNQYFGLDHNIANEDIIPQVQLNQSLFANKLRLDAEEQQITLDQCLIQLADELIEKPDFEYKNIALGFEPLSTIALGLVTNAIYDLGKMGGGALLTKMGLMDDPDADHKAVMAELKEISTTLSRVDSNVKETLIRVKQIQKQLEEMSQKLDDIKQKQDIQLLLTQTVALSTYVERVKTIYFDMQNAAYLPRHQIASERKRLKTAIEELMKDRTLIANALLDAPGKPSMVTALVDSLYPKVTTHWRVPQFISQKVLDQFGDFVTHYDDINILAYYMFITYYNDDDYSKGIETVTCDLDAQSDITSRQCLLYRELLLAREKYRVLIPQRRLPVENMFVYLGSGEYLKSQHPGVVYPVGNIAYKDVKSFYGGLEESATQIVADNMVQAGFQFLLEEKQNEIQAMVNWEHWMNFTRGGTWYRLITDPRTPDETLLNTAIKHGADPLAFRVAEGEYRGWLSNGSSEWMADRLDHDQHEELNDATIAKYLVLGQFKNMDVVQIYLGQTFANRFQ